MVQVVSLQIPQASLNLGSLQVFDVSVTIPVQLSIGHVGYFSSVLLNPSTEEKEAEGRINRKTMVTLRSITSFDHGGVIR